MMNNNKREFVSPEGLRNDGRRPKEERKIEAKLNILPQIDGSSLFEIGNTRVLASIYGPKEPASRSMVKMDRLTIRAKVHQASFGKDFKKSQSISYSQEQSSQISSSTILQSRTERKMEEWSLILEEVFQATILSHLYPRSELKINVEVLNADGAVLAACINATTLALLSAGIALYDSSLAVQVGYLTKNVLIDLNREEEVGCQQGKGGGEPLLTLVSWPNKEGSVVGMWCEGRTTPDKLESMLNASHASIKSLYKMINEKSVKRDFLEKMLLNRCQ